MDPITTALAAFAAVQQTVKVIKTASKTVDDVASLGPLIGKYFGHKAETTKALAQAKKTGGSNLQQAIEIEMALLSQKQFEDELQMIFMTTGHIDVWNKIMARVAESNKAEIEEARKQKAAQKRRQRQIQEIVEISIGVLLLVLLVPPTIWLVVKVLGG